MGTVGTQAISLNMNLALTLEHHTHRVWKKRKKRSSRVGEQRLVFGSERGPSKGTEALPHALPCAARRSGCFELRVYPSTINQDSSEGKKKERKKKEWEKNTSYFVSVSTTERPSSSHRRKPRWGRLKQTTLHYTDPPGDASPQRQTWRHWAQHGFEAGASRSGVASSFLSFACPARPTQRRPGQFQVQLSIASGRTRLSRPVRALCHQPHSHYAALSPPVIASLFTATTAQKPPCGLLFPSHSTPFPHCPAICLSLLMAVNIPYSQALLVSLRGGGLSQPQPRLGVRHSTHSFPLLSPYLVRGLRVHAF